MKIKMRKTPAFKVGDKILNGRVIVGVEIGLNALGNKTRIYLYRYDTERETIEPLRCSEETLIRRTYA